MASNTSISGTSYFVRGQMLLSEQRAEVGSIEEIDLTKKATGSDYGFIIKRGRRRRDCFNSSLLIRFDCCTLLAFVVTAPSFDQLRQWYYDDGIMDRQTPIRRNNHQRILWIVEYVDLPTNPYSVQTEWNSREIAGESANRLEN